MKRNAIGILVIMLGIMLIGCPTPVSDSPKSSAKAITAFSLASPSTTATINEIAHTIALTVPFGTNATNLVATFVTTGTQVKVGSAVQASGISANDFTSPVTYTVVAADASTQDYAVTVTAELLMIPVNGGTFSMGSTAAGSDVEQPVHSVTISNFLIAAYEVTQAQYQTVMGSNPSYFTGDASRPVEMVSWFDAVAFCNARSALEGLTACYTISGTTVGVDFTKNGYRLPTEAEWEFASLGGTESLGRRYSGSNDLDAVAWWNDNSGSTTNLMGTIDPNEPGTYNKSSIYSYSGLYAVVRCGDPGSTTHPAGTKVANELGIFDMSGNVSEWCNDWYASYGSSAQIDPPGPASGSARVLRGGTFGGFGEFYLRCYGRFDFSPNVRSNGFGFRVVRRGG